MNPTVSVVMACYNEEQFLREAVKSILNQSLTSLELIVVNDGSCDSTGQILDLLSGMDARIRILTNAQNEGLSPSLNKGIKTAKSDLIARMDADDIAHPDRLKHQIEYMTLHPNIDILGTAIACIDKKTNRKKGIRKIPERHQEIKKRVFKKPLVFHPTIVIKKEIYELYGFYDPSVKWAEDADLWYRIYDKVIFHNLPEVLLTYRVKSSLSIKVMTGNLKSKYFHLKKRKLLFSYIHILIRDFFTLSFRMIHNY